MRRYWRKQRPRKKEGAHSADIIKPLQQPLIGTFKSFFSPFISAGERSGWGPKERWVWPTRGGGKNINPHHNKMLPPHCTQFTFCHTTGLIVVACGVHGNVQHRCLPMTVCTLKLVCCHVFCIWDYWESFSVFPFLVSICCTFSTRASENTAQSDQHPQGHVAFSKVTEQQMICFLFSCMCSKMLLNIIFLLRE